MYSLASFVDEPAACILALETPAAGAECFNLADSCSLPPRLDDLPLLPAADRSPSCLGYGDPDGAEPLRSAVAALYPGALPEDVLITAGATEANYLALSALCEPGDRVIVATPTYLSATARGSASPRRNSGVLEASARGRLAPGAE